MRSLFSGFTSRRKWELRYVSQGFLRSSMAAMIFYRWAKRFQNIEKTLCSAACFNVQMWICYFPRRVSQYPLHLAASTLSLGNSTITIIGQTCTSIVIRAVHDFIRPQSVLTWAPRSWLHVQSVDKVQFSFYCQRTRPASGSGCLFGFSISNFWNLNGSVDNF